jgi:hypothetical protein
MPDPNPGSASRRLFRLLAWLPALAAPLLIYQWMRDYLINVPFMDDYVWLHIYEKIHAGTFSWWNDTFFVQMEHRLNVPAFLAALFCYWKPGQIILHNWCSYAQLCLMGINVLILMRQTMPGLRHQWLIGAVAMWVLFSPVQASTLLWGDCFSSYMGPFFLSLVLVLFQSRLPFEIKLLLCLAMTVLGSLSLACGLNIWIVMAVLIAFSGKLKGWRRWAFLGIWLVAFAVTLKLYFTNFVNQAEPEFSYQQGTEVTVGKEEHLNAVLQNPGHAARFVLMLVGSMMGRGTFASMSEAAFYTGLVLVTALVIFAGLAIWKRKEEDSLTATMPWLVFGLYSIGTGGMVALGRLYASPSLIGALWNRYTIHTMPIVIAVVVLGAYWWQRGMAKQAGTSPVWYDRLRYTGPLLLGAMMCWVGVGWCYGLDFMETWWSSRLRDATSQMFFDTGADVREKTDAKEGKFQPMQPLTKNVKYARRMNAIGLLQPPMVRGNRLDQFPLLGKLSVSQARLDSIVQGPPGVFSVDGMAYLHGQSRPADGIILAYKNAEGAWIMFAMTQEMTFPRFLRETLGPDLQYLYRPSLSERHNFAGFEVDVDRSLLPPGDVEVAAFAFDFKKLGFYQLPNRYTVNAEKGTATRIEEEKPAKDSKG